VFLTGLVARELGARIFGQALAALAFLVAPGFLALDNLLSMNAFEPLFWTGCAFVMIRIVKTGNPKLWLWFGLLAGLGLENKHSMLIFGAGLVLGLLLTPERRFLRSPWLLIGGLVAFLAFLPNLLWNIQHHFPFLELQANIRRNGRNVDLSLFQFFGEEALTMLPLSVPIWLAGLWHLLFTKEGKPFRALGWAWLIATVVILILNPRVYYLWPAFPILLAAGAVRWELWLARPGVRWIKVGYVALMVAMGVVLAPLAIPVLPVETYIHYTKTLHLEQPRVETHRLGPLPQIFADQFGWEEMVAVVARAFNRLPPEVQAKTAIFGQNYGQAGAVDLFGPKYGLPKAISGHQNYFLWGPRDYTGESVIVMDNRREELETNFASVEKVGEVFHPYSMPYEHFDVFYCRGLKQPLKKIWPTVKNWN
jgi:Dolichyl-phosphate-mannose-protein mannosyltransferase